MPESAWKGNYAAGYHSSSCAHNPAGCLTHGRLFIAVCWFGRWTPSLDSEDWSKLQRHTGPGRRQTGTASRHPTPTPPPQAYSLSQSSLQTGHVSRSGSPSTGKRMAGSTLNKPEKQPSSTLEPKASGSHPHLPLRSKVSYQRPESFHSLASPLPFRPAATGRSGAARGLPAAPGGWSVSWGLSLSWTLHP